jgi:hypothetical protein
MRWIDSVMFSQDPLSGVYSGITPCSNNHTTNAGVDTGVINSATRLDTGAFKMLLADVALLVPPRSQILDQLLELADAANMVNLLLDDARHPGLTIGDATVPKRRLLEIQGRLNRVRDLARECDQYVGDRLAALSSTTVVR